MARHTLTQLQWVSEPRSLVSRYFEAPENLEELTPPFLKFRIRTPAPIAMAEGTQIEYRIALHGVTMRWLTRIEQFVPGERFVDVQLAGPYRLWRHTHTFEDERGGTRLTDRVEFGLPLGCLGEAAYRLFVRRNLEAIFSYRATRIAELFGGNASMAKPNFA